MPTPKFLSLQEVLRIHDRQIDRFGGSKGLRDRGLLQSALAQPEATFGGELLHPTGFDQAAAYLYHLSRNHPFIDGNKRTAFAVTDTFLRANGYRLTLSNDRAYELVLQAAQGQITKENLAEILRSNVTPSP